MLYQATMRSQRYSVKRTAHTANTAPKMASPTRNSSRAPATNKSMKVSSKSTEGAAEVRCLRHKTIKKPAMSRWGSMPIENDRTRSRFFSREYASHRIRPSLAVSEGWMCTGPTDNQRAAPPPL